MTHIGKTTWKFLGCFGVLVVFNLESTKTAVAKHCVNFMFYGYLNFESTKTGSVESTRLEVFYGYLNLESTKTETCCYSC